MSFKWWDAALAEDPSKVKLSDEKKSAQREVARDCFNTDRYLTTFIIVNIVNACCALAARQF